MANYGKWEIVDELGEGGQGKVYLARDTTSYNRGLLVSELATSLQSLSGGIVPAEARVNHAEKVAENLIKLMEADDPTNLGALKVLHQPTEERNASKATERMKREIDTLSSIDHPNILKILDHNIDSGWFVSEYHPNGTLDSQLNLFKGNLKASLEALRPLVGGVEVLHGKGLVHRDIKPGNIFVASDGRLVLGDMGLVFFTDEGRTRISDTYENVGSRDWMPAWAMGMKIEDINPTFDIYSLAKVLWSMVSNKKIMRLWYYNEDDFNLEKLFPAYQSMKWANWLISKCIVEHENSCLPEVSLFLHFVNEVLFAIQVGAYVIEQGAVWPCNVCGLGEYRCIIDRNPAEQRNFGLNPAGDQRFKIFACIRCGNVQLFSVPTSKIPPSWS